jgi:hypothetical protein
MSRRYWGFVVLVLLIVATVLSGCCGPWCDWIEGIRGVRVERLRGSGRLVTRDMDYRDFTKLEVSHAFEVDLVQSRSYSVVITTDDNVIDEVEVTKFGNTLRIGLKEIFINIQGVTLRAEVSMPTLEALDLSGATSLKGEMDTGDVRFELSGASRLTLDGTGGDMRIDASGASHADLSDFVVDDADVEVSGASRATVNVTGRLDVDASGASHVDYLGDPILGRIDTSGASSVSPAR